MKVNLRRYRQIVHSSLRRSAGRPWVALAAAFSEAGMVVREDFGTIESFERSRDGVRVHFSAKGSIAR